MGDRCTYFDLRWIYGVILREYEHEMKEDTGIWTLCGTEIDVPFEKVVIEGLGRDGAEIRSLELDEIATEPSQCSLFLLLCRV
jgi:hypothetical protein